jgi:branched-chain amino acid transport system permease protein
MAILTTTDPFWLPADLGLIAIAFALLVGLPLRLRGDYFAIATIAAAEAIRLFAERPGPTGAPRAPSASAIVGTPSDTIQGWISTSGGPTSGLFPLFLVSGW